VDLYLQGKNEFMHGASGFPVSEEREKKKISVAVYGGGGREAADRWRPQLAEGQCIMHGEEGDPRHYNEYEAREGAFPPITGRGGGEGEGGGEFCCLCPEGKGETNCRGGMKKKKGGDFLSP